MHSALKDFICLADRPVLPDNVCVSVILCLDGEMPSFGGPPFLAAVWVKLREPPNPIPSFPFFHDFLTIDSIGWFLDHVIFGVSPQESIVGLSQPKSGRGVWGGLTQK